MNTTLLACSATLVLLTLVLAFWTSLQRGASKTIAYGAPLEPTSGMAKAQRAHGNTAEYAGLLIGLFVVLDLATAAVPGWLAWTAIAITVSRVLAAIGFLTGPTLEKPHIFKMIGALVTYVGGIIIAGYLLGRAAGVFTGGVSL